MKATTLTEALDRAGIAPKRYNAGTSRCPCPACKRGAKDDALGLTIGEDGSAVWHCFRCSLTGAWRPRDAMPPQLKRSGQHSLPAKNANPTGLSDQGRRLWAAAQPITPSCLAGRYLAGRCCALPGNGVRFHREVWHAQERRAFPAMVALITDIITGGPVSLHFTFLADDGSGKAEIDRKRLYLAGHRKQGGVVRLHRDDDVTIGVIIGEGLETCLTAALEFGPVWACLDAGTLAAFPILPGLSGLTVLVDHDEAGNRAAAEVRGRYAKAGIEVVEIKAAAAGADLNDLVAA